MTKVMLVQPWNYHDEGVREHNLAHEWRNGPYSLLLLATQLRKYNHQVVVVDMTRDLVILKGDVEACLAKFSSSIRQFRPDIIGFGFFSIHYFETQKAVNVARQICAQIGIQPLFIAGGIHASIEPKETIEKLGFDYAFMGEADLGIVQLANGQKPEIIPGVVGVVEDFEMTVNLKGKEVSPLDSLPFPDWSLCDYQFYAYPSYGKVNFRAARTLDMLMGRGCVYKCAFCAYNTLSSVRFYSAEYLVEQTEYMAREFGADSIYFVDSSIGNNRKLLTEYCELMIQRGISERIEWYGNIRPNQVNESLLKLMWRAGCRFLLYGFESGSQRVLDLMAKSIDVEANYRAAELHNKLKFPYHASILLGYPGECEEDILQTFEFLRKMRPPLIGINWYVPLPGSPDYNNLKREGIIKTNDPWEWRRIGEVNSARVYADVSEKRFRQLFAEAERMAYVELPKMAHIAWRCMTPPQDSVEDKIVGQNRYQLTFRKTTLKILRAIRRYCI